jgi:hypothetical protein
LVVLLALSGRVADVVVLFGVLVLVLSNLLGTVVQFVLRDRMLVIPMFVTVLSVAVNQALYLVL